MTPDPSDLARRFADRKATLGIVGMGYVGLPLMLAATASGFRVLGFDIDLVKIEGLNAGRSPLKHIGDAPVQAARASGLFEATADLARSAEADAILICVPTPSGPHREPDLGYVESTTRAIAPHLRRGQLVVLESTTWPGTTREVMKPILEAGGLRSGVDFFLAYSPEREDPGNIDFETSRIPKVVGGDGPAALLAGPGALRPARRQDGAGLLARDGRGREAHREHLPRRQHRAGQRAQARLRRRWASTSGR